MAGLLIRHGDVPPLAQANASPCNASKATSLRQRGKGDSEKHQADVFVAALIGTLDFLPVNGNRV